MLKRVAISRHREKWIQFGAARARRVKRDLFRNGTRTSQLGGTANPEPNIVSILPPMSLRRSCTCETVLLNIHDPII
jgi:hypothetical protein